MRDTALVLSDPEVLKIEVAHHSLLLSKKYCQRLSEFVGKEVRRTITVHTQLNADTVIEWMAKILDEFSKKGRVVDSEGYEVEVSGAAVAIAFRISDDGDFDTANKWIPRFLGWATMPLKRRAYRNTLRRLQLLDAAARIRGFA